jgi:hypothetical protein
MSYWELWFCRITKCHLDSQSNGSCRLGNTADDNAKIPTRICMHTQHPLLTPGPHIHPYPQIHPRTHTPTHIHPPIHTHFHPCTDIHTDTPHNRQCPYPEPCLLKTVWLQTDESECTVYSSLMALLKLSAMFKVKVSLRDKTLITALCLYCFKPPLSYCSS